VSFREAEASFSSAVAVQVSGGWRLLSALRRRQSFREVEALTALRRRILHRGGLSVGFLALVMFEFRGCFSRWWKREATVSSWCVSVSRGCYSGVCSNGGGDDLAPAIDLAGKDFSGVQDGGDGECW
ncbi:hypothetical protein HID58_084752, partial [Brassica napus]